MTITSFSAEDLEGAAQEKGEFSDDTMDMWQLYGVPLEIFKIVREVTGIRQTKDGPKPTVSLICESQIQDSNDKITHWVSGRLAGPIKKFFEAHHKDSSLKIVFWLDPVVNGKEYLGWTGLSWGVEPDDFAIPQKAAKQAVRSVK